MASKALRSVMPIERIASHIWVLRDQKVLLDYDLAELYGVETRVLNQAVIRNLKRFPADFMFRLKPAEVESLNQSQSVIGSATQKHRDPRHPPRAFTQEGIAMLSGVLSSPKAIMINVEIMRAFVKLRNMYMSHEELSRRVTQHDNDINALFEHVNHLLMPPEPEPRKRIGFPTPPPSKRRKKS